MVTLGGGGHRHFRNFRHYVLAIFQIFGVNVETIKRQIVHKVCVKGKVDCNDVLDMCTKIWQ